MYHGTNLRKKVTKRLPNSTDSVFGVHLPSLEIHPGQRIADYEVISQIAQGGMATVFSVRDLRSGATNALKLLLPLEHAEESKSRFRREFRALSRLNHPNVLKVYEGGLLGDRPWYTMELLEGHDLRTGADHFPAQPEKRFQRIRQVLTQAARALAYIHGRGLVHRDVTPGNLYVTTDGTVKLMDFGVVKDMGADLTAVGEVIGTIAYMAPEQIRSETLDPRADLYSLGAVLYLMLTGQRPFSAHTIHGFMEQHLHQTPKPPSELNPNVPTDLQDICMRLLEKKPQDRLASAYHLLQRLGDDSSSDIEDAWPPVTVGRTLLRAEVQESLEQINQGQPGKAFVFHAPLGGGVTRMLQYGAHQAQRQAIRLARGVCRKGDRPFGGFSAIFEALCNADTPQLLWDTFGVEQVAGTERYPIMAAFRDLVLHRAPCVIVLDDVDEADPASNDLLNFLLRNTLELAGEPVTYLIGSKGTFRANAAVIYKPLEPLDPSEVEELVGTVLKSTPATSLLARRLFDESKGIPSYVADVLHSLIDEGHFVRSTNGKHELAIAASEITHSSLPMPRSLRQALKTRTRALSPDSLLLSQFLAISRTPITLDLLASVIHFDDLELMDALDELVDTDIALEHRSEDSELFELSHSRLKEILLESLNEEQIQTLHVQYAEALEKSFRSKLSSIATELAYHFDEGQMHSKAFAYHLRAGELHLRNSAFEGALSHLRRAVVLEPKARRYSMLDRAEKKLATVHLAISKAAFNLGELDKALESVQRAKKISTQLRDVKLQSRIACELGVQLRRQGRFTEAEAHLHQAVTFAKEVGDQRLLPEALYTLGGIAWGNKDLSEAEMLWKQTLQIGQQIGDERAQGNGTNGLGILAICRGESLVARRHLEKAAKLFESVGSIDTLVVVRVNLIETYLITGVLKKALLLAKRTEGQSEEVGHPTGIGLGLAWQGRVLLYLGRVADALKCSQKALKVLTSVSAVEDTIVAGVTLVRCASAMGDHHTALSHIHSLFDALKTHDTEGLLPEAIAMKSEILARLGRLKEAKAALAVWQSPKSAWPHVQVKSQLAYARACQAVGETSKAQAALTAALRTTEAHGYRLFKLQIHRMLATIELDASARARHLRMMEALARSLASNLAKNDSERFLAPYVPTP